MQNFFSKFLGRILVVQFLFSCSSDPIQLKDLIGEYAGNRELSSDRLIIRCDSTYELQFRSSKGKIFRNTGKWKLRQDLPEITFHDFIFFNDEGPDKVIAEKNGSEVILKGDWIARIRITPGELKIMYDSEHEIFYYRKLLD